ncbi:hypothetical protein D3C80_1969950 [compost metagenome]
MVASLLCLWPWEDGRLNWLKFKLGNKCDSIVVRATERAQAQPFTAGFALHNPFAPTGTNQVPGHEIVFKLGHCVLSYLPNTSG